MRLIDADKLIDNLDAMIPDYDYSDTSMGIATAIQEAGRMAFYEEVNAIPIEWLDKWIETIYNDDRLSDEEYGDLCCCYSRLKWDWYKENEQNKKNTSQTD